MASDTDASSPSAVWSPASMIAGPIAGVCSRFFIYPVDTVKARLQVQGSLATGGNYVLYNGTWDAIKKISNREGLRGFYKGFGAVVLGNIPANSAYFSGYELGKKLVPGDMGLAGDMVVGAVAQLTGGLLFTPVDVIKERMQVQGMLAQAGKGHAAPNSWHIVKELVAQQGVLGLFRGYWATNGVWIPWSAIHISLYESLKRLASKAYKEETTYQGHADASPSPALSLKDEDGPTSQSHTISSSASDVQSGASSHSSTNAVLSTSNSEEESIIRQRQAQSQTELPPWVLGTCSAVSASVASVLTHPMDVIKTRMQVLSGMAHQGQRLTSWQIAKEALQKEGPKVFLAGATARVLTLAPGTALSWMVYEPIKSFLDKTLA